MLYGGEPKRETLEELLKEQLLLGMEDGPPAHTLKIFAHRNPEVTFAGLQHEILLLAEENQQEWYDTTCVLVKDNNVRPSVSPSVTWSDKLKKEIIEEVTQPI